LPEREKAADVALCLLDEPGARQIAEEILDANYENWRMEA